MAVVVPGLDLGGSPSRGEQDRRVLESNRAAGSRPGSGTKGKMARVRNNSESSIPARGVAGEAIEGLEDAQLDVQGQQFVERTGGHRRGHQRAYTPPQLIQDGRLILTKPLDTHDAPPGVRRILRAQALISNCLHGRGTA